MSITSRAATLASAAPSGKIAEVLASRVRHGSDDKPGLRKDLVARRLVQMGEVSWAVKNPESLKVFSFGEEEWGLIELFDGERTRAEIQIEYARRHPDAAVPLQTVLDYEESLRKMDLIAQEGAERNLALVQRLRDARRIAAEEKEEGFNIFLIPFHVADPNNFLNRTVKYVRWLWTPPAVAGGFVLFFLTASVFAQHFTTIWAQTIELYAFLRKPFWDFLQFFCIMTVIGAVHELGHAYAMKIHGGDVHDIGFALFYFTPAYYCDTTDSYLFQNKYHRLWVTLGGIYVESYICVIATFLWVVTYPDTVLHEIAYKTMLYTGVSTVFFNINPMVKTDGYNVFSSILELPEMREESFRYLGALIQRYILRLPVEVPVYPRRKRRIYLVYAPLALAYTGFVMYLIAGLFNHLYSRLFPDFATVLLLLTLYRVFRKRARIFTGVVRMFYLDKKEFLMSPKIVRVLAAVAAILLLAAIVPWSQQTISGEAVLEPVRVLRVGAPEDGVVVRTGVREGDEVHRDQPLLELASGSLDQEMGALTAEAIGLRSQASAGLAGADPRAAFQAQEQARAVSAELSRDRSRRERLIVRSPATGRILTPAVEELAGRFVRAGTPLLEVGDSRQFRAEIPVTERLVEDVRVGTPVTVQLRARPLRLLHGTVTAVSAATVGARTTAAPGDKDLLPSDIPEKFTVIATFPGAETGLVTGMQGDAKIALGRRSFVGRGLRIFQDWIDRIAW